MLNDANILALKVFWVPRDPDEVQEHDVPVLIRSRELILNLNCDLALQQVRFIVLYCKHYLHSCLTHTPHTYLPTSLPVCPPIQVIPHIDGTKFVKRISLDADVDIDIVKRSIRTLLYYDCVSLTDIFQYSNVYIVTEKVSSTHRLAHEKR